MDIPVHEEVTYDDMGVSVDHLWNFLYFTGYLTKTGAYLSGDSIILKMKIPNAEVKSIYKNTISGWFHESIRKQDFQDLYRAMEDQDTGAMAHILNSQSSNPQSVFMTARKTVTMVFWQVF